MSKSPSSRSRASGRVTLSDVAARAGVAPMTAWHGGTDPLILVLCIALQGVFPPRS